MIQRKQLTPQFIRVKERIAKITSKAHIDSGVDKLQIQRLVDKLVEATYPKEAKPLTRKATSPDWDI